MIRDHLLALPQSCHYLAVKLVSLVVSVQHRELRWSSCFLVEVVGCPLSRHLDFLFWSASGCIVRLTLYAYLWCPRSWLRGHSLLFGNNGSRVKLSCEALTGEIVDCPNTLILDQRVKIHLCSLSTPKLAFPHGHPKHIVSPFPHYTPPHGIFTHLDGESQ